MGHNKDTTVFILWLTFLMAYFGSPARSLRGAIGLFLRPAKFYHHPHNPLPPPRPPPPAGPAIHPSSRRLPAPLPLPPLRPLPPLPSPAGAFSFISPLQMLSCLPNYGRAEAKRLQMGPIYIQMSCFLTFGAIPPRCPTVLSTNILTNTNTAEYKQMRALAEEPAHRREHTQGHPAKKHTYTHTPKHTRTHAARLGGITPSIGRQ